MINELSGLLQEGDLGEEIKALKEALREKSEEIERLKTAVDEKPLFGEWQLCPKCAGYGAIFHNQITMQYPYGWSTCGVCSGAKIIKRPIIPPSK